MLPSAFATHLRTLFVLPALAGLLLACQAPPPAAPPAPPPPARADRIVLLPQADGTPSAVVVRAASGEEAVLAQPYATADAGAAGVRVSEGAADAVRARYPALFDAMPMARVSHVVYFEFGGDRLTAESAQRLREIVRGVAALPAPEIKVVGHTDGVGNDGFNDNLSLQRARIVRGLLLEHGVDEKRIEVVGRGRREPLVAARPGVPEARNRRVEIQVR